MVCLGTHQNKQRCQRQGSYGSLQYDWKFLILGAGVLANAMLQMAAGARAPSSQPRPVLPAKRERKRKPSATAAGRPRKRSPSTSPSDTAAKRLKTSKYQGVSWHKGNTKLRANIYYRASPFFFADNVFGVQTPLC